MRIGIFSPSDKLYSETFIQAHKTELPGEVFYFYGSPGRLRLENGKLPRVSRFIQIVTFIRKKLGSSITPYWQRTLVKSLKDNRIDVLLVEYGPHANALLPAIRDSKLPVVVHFHGYDASKYSVIEMNGQYREVFDYADTIIAVSRKMESMLLDLGCPREKLVYNVYGPRNEFLEVSPRFSKEQFVAIGRFVPKKAPYYLILAMHKVVQEFPGAQLIIAGDGELKEICQNLVNALGLEANVTLPGVVDSLQYIGYLEESVAFIQHSVRAENGDMEGTPLAVLEASAAGVPVISTLHAGIPDVVVHGETGLLSDEHDVDSMAGNMMALLRERDRAITLGNKGKERIKNHFTLKRHIDELASTLCNSI